MNRFIRSEVLYSKKFIDYDQKIVCTSNVSTSIGILRQENENNRFFFRFLAQ